MSAWKERLEAAANILDYRIRKGDGDQVILDDDTAGIALKAIVSLISTQSVLAEFFDAYKTYEMSPLDSFDLRDAKRRLDDLEAKVKASLHQEAA